MTGCDALIVGGGPAGLAAAIALRQQNLDVLVADALRPPIDKACGEGLMPDSQEALRELGVAIGHRDGRQFEGIAFLAPGVSIAARFSGELGTGIRRLRLHTLLANRCLELGVRLGWETNVALDPGARVRVGGESCRYRYLIGADGLSSRVRAWSGLERASAASKRFGQRRHFRIAPWSRMVEVHWGAAGQAYVTAVGSDEVCVATVCRSASARMEAVLEDLPELRRRLDGAAPLSATRGAATMTRRLRHVTAGNVALVGDASGSVDAITGEGLALSFRQALLLARALAADSLETYEQGHPAILRPPQTISKLLLAMDRWPALRGRALGVFARQPEAFRQLLALHVADSGLPALLHEGARLAWRMLAAPAA